jgi:hypothetical protein
MRYLFGFVCVLALGLMGCRQIGKTKALSVRFGTRHNI